MPLYIDTGSYQHANGGCCYRCNRNERLIDTDCYIEGEGALAFCSSCVIEFAEAASLTFNEGKVRELEADLTDARQARDRAQRIEARLQGVISRIQKAGSHV